ncbi:restriction endonuclease subunit S [Lacticaseibacillus paracasei]|uniref:Type I restriction-modification system, specificity subunit S n=1 Tax=Lacticaseibacillus paracasei subsp. paracasei Lpp122 TaxID=1256218 RepID=A0A8E0I5G5_LACPA|nr:restriction endonuclease subunit S [Lacticaseibacillus paracasei]EPC19360.1 Type I restriction-modification system, specificity subunit S [Lacticaseibacillus paracasei subsp. paracasei Lpp122]
MSKIRDHQSTQPAIRFKGFTDAWEKRKLGKWFAERTERSGEGEMLSVTISSGVVRANSLDRKDNSSTDKSNYKVVHIGDIAYNSMRMWQAASGVSNYDGIVSPAYTVLVPAAEVSSVFFGYQFKQTKMKQIFQRNSQGLTSDTWNLKYPLLAKIKTSAPQKTEQVKIGTFFATLDHLIAVNQRKGDVLQNLKKGLLQRLFASETSPIPDIRFKGFTDAWEKRKLGEIARIFDGTHQTPNYQSSGIMFLSVENIQTLKSNKFISLEDFQKDFKVSPRTGDILMTRIGNIGTTNVVKSTRPIAYYVSLALIRPNDAIDVYYLNYAINGLSFQRELRRRTLSVAFPQKINKQEIGKSIVDLPSPSEQIQIGNLFVLLDNLIAATQRKGEVLKNLKKALLQKMFV